MRLFWHRRDLRAADNRGLAAAATDDGGGTVVPAFVFDDALLERAGAPRVRYVLDALADLRAWYRERGSDLVVARGEPSAAVPALSRSTTPTGRTGTRTTRGWRASATWPSRRRSPGNWSTCGFHDAVHHQPGDITTNDGDPYRVYGYFWKKWRDRGKRDPGDPPAADALAAVEGDDLPSVEELGFEGPDADVQSGGAEAARERLDAFCEGPIHDYEEARDYPAREATSRLSADLKRGTVGVREVDAAATEACEGRTGDAEESVEAFRSQLVWREFYAQVLWDEPSVVTENYRSYAEPIEWRDAPPTAARGRTARRDTPSSTRGCASCARRRSCTTGCGWSSPPFSRRTSGSTGGRDTTTSATTSRTTHRQRHRRLTVGRLHRDGRPAVLPGVQPRHAGRAVRPRR